MKAKFKVLSPIYPPERTWTHKMCSGCGDLKTMPEDADVCGYCLYKGSLPSPRVPALSNLGSVRRRRGMSRSELAAKAGTEYSVIYRQESGLRRFAQRDIANRIARILEVEIEELIL